ncbi:hypothetical protein BURCENBC7_AP3402 [Burkholderia cenocepacia BC7]|nr:uncharacterized protein BCN122_II0958 [Burkholderia cenocepacia]EPZ89307.1 hypothetical protein BURCENK562V_C2894 [Burkholderia cenocepacia K56-2Valvano]ERI26921.1 hypothetical protein BURCENBC7_AP3402 [Burkholderia cenocepacia BC7]CDN62629.1 hypothetical protein I35_4793 [Burkholderia cenocepacia H111]
MRTIGHHALLVRTERHGRATGAAHRGPACDGQAGERNEYAPDSPPRCTVVRHF